MKKKIKNNKSILTISNKYISDNHFSFKIKDLDTGKIYPSMHKAYLDTGCNDKCIKKCCESKYKAIKSKDLLKDLLKG